MLLCTYMTVAAVPPIATVFELPPVVVSTVIKLICIVTGVDPPRIGIWAFNGAVIYNASEATGFNISREISNTDYGTYTCSISNEFGSSSRAIEVLQAGIYIYIYILYAIVSR